MNNSEERKPGNGHLILKAIYQAYFEPREKILSGWVRFIWTFAGAVSFYTWYLLSISGNTTNISTTPSASYFLQDLSPTHMIMILMSFMYGGLSISSQGKHGPIRYYILGVILPAFVIVVASISLK